MRGQPLRKLGLAGVGAVLFLVGVRRDDATLRWVGIGWFAAAFLTRFRDRSSRRVGRPGVAASSTTTGTEETSADG